MRGGSKRQGGRKKAAGGNEKRANDAVLRERP